MFIGELHEGNYYLHPRKLLTALCNRNHWEAQDLPELTDWLETQLERIKQ